MYSSDLKTTRETADYFRVSIRTLQKWRTTGLFQLGIHYRQKFPTKQSHYLYDLAACEEAINQAFARDVQTLEIAEV